MINCANLVLFLAGFILKKSAKTNGWSRRWFVLNEKTGKVCKIGSKPAKLKLTCTNWGSMISRHVNSCDIIHLVIADVATSINVIVICRIYFDLSFILQLGYTKKQEERHFRGVITLEVRTTVNTCMLSDLRLVMLFPK